MSITEVKFSGKPKRSIKSIEVDIDGETVKIPVSSEVYAYWEQQFVRSNPTPLQRKKFATLMNVVRAAFKEGVRRSRGT